jgi:hypothetical protein
MATKPNVARRRYTRTGLYIRSSRGLKARDQRTTRLATRMFGVMPWLQPADQIAVRKLAQLEFLSERLFIELRARGLLTESGEPRRLVGDFQRLISTMVSLLNALGMTPAGRQSIGATVKDVLDLQAFRSDAETIAPGDGNGAASDFHGNGR